MPFPFMAAPHAALLHAQALCFSRNEERIFGPLDFHLDAGEALLIKGDNGSGKTTLLRVLCGLLPPESGTVYLQGTVFEREHFNRIAGYLGHKHGHKAELTVLQNLRFYAALKGSFRLDEIERLLTECGLAGYEDTAAGKLSAGQNKRLSLARLHLTHCPLWLLDEPYANLDLHGIAWVTRMIEAHIASGGAALISTHGAYAAPAVPVRQLELKRGGAYA